MEEQTPNIENKSISEPLELAIPISPLAQFANAIAVEETESTGRYPDVYEQYSPNHLTKIEQKNNTFLFICENGVQLKIEILTQHIIRFRYAPRRKFQRDFSYAIDPKFEAKEVEIKLEESEDAYTIKTNVLDCKIHKEGLLVQLSDKNGTPICRDAKPYRALSTLLTGLSEVRISHTAHEGESYYGLGDKSSALNLRGQKKENWNTDAFAYDEERDPLYRTVPFYFGLNKSKAYGIFFDNSYRTHFDFDSNVEGITSFYAEGGEMNYYFIYGPELLQVAERYTQLTGCPELPPLWSLGFHQCRWSYYPEERVRAVASEFRARQIPCDAIYLDIDYMDGYRCFTWNKDHFPDPKSLTLDLEGQGFQTVVMIDPGIRVDENYHVYQSGMQNEVFCNRTSGELMVGPVWPPACVFPDFTRPDVRSWFGKLYEELYVEQGISGFWNDMNEPAMFKVDRATFPDNVLHDYEGELTDHRKAHNIYGQQMSRSTVEGLKELKPNKRPFLVTRATYSGGQRFSAVWTGDNVASWEHLHLANTQCQRLSISGFSFVGSDIGGFAGVPTGELMVRWLQLGIFHPFYRIHSIGNNVDGASETEQDAIQEQERLNRLDQEPWVFGEQYESLMRSAIELRYRLLPYIYTTFWQHVNYGTPMIKSMVFYDQHDPETYDLESQFIFGNHMLVCPVEQASTPEGLIIEEKEDIEEELAEQVFDLSETDGVQEAKLISTLETEDQIEETQDAATPLITEQHIYLPKGRWYDFDSKAAYEGNQHLTIPVELSKIPIFVKAGAVIPLYPVQQYVGEKEIEEVLLHAFYVNGESKSQLYEDAGEGYGYEDGNYNLKTFHVEGTGNTFTLTRWQEGIYVEEHSTYRISIHGLPFEISSCKVDNRKIPFEQMAGTNCIEVTILADFGELELGV